MDSINTELTSNIIAKATNSLLNAEIVKIRVVNY